MIMWKTDRPIAFSTNREIKNAPLHLGNINLHTLKFPATFLAYVDCKEGIAIAVTHGRVQVRHMKLLLRMGELHNRIDPGQASAALDELNLLYPDAV